MEDTERKEIYERAGRLASEDSEESLEKAVELYKSIIEWEDAGVRCAACETRRA